MLTYAIFSPESSVRAPTPQELIKGNQISDENVLKCFDRSVKNMDRKFLRARPSGSRVSVLLMLKNIVATSVVYWVKWKLGEQFRSNREVHAAICSLDKLTESKAWIAPADPLSGVLGLKNKRKKPETLPTEIELVLSDGEVDAVYIDDSNDDDDDGDKN